MDHGCTPRPYKTDDVGVSAAQGMAARVARLHFARSWMSVGNLFAALRDQRHRWGSGPTYAWLQAGGAGSFSTAATSAGRAKIANPYRPCWRLRRAVPTASMVRSS